MLLKDADLIRRALDEVIASPEFSTSPVLSKFLRFIVEETLAGREQQLKSAIIAHSVLQRPLQDERAENAVRTSAVRLRAALNAYNSREGAAKPVIIVVPKGGYIPEFTFADAQPEVLEARPRGRRWRSMAIVLFALIAAIFMAREVALHFGQVGTAEGLQLFVDSTEAANDESAGLARAVQYRLAPMLSEIGLARIISAANKPTVSPTPQELTFALHSQADATSGKLIWYLSDDKGGVVASGVQKLESDGAENVAMAASRIAFQILGEEGALPLILARHYGAAFHGTMCKVRAQLLLRADDMAYFEEVTQCLREYLVDHANDAEAWASLGETLAVRMRYYDAYVRSDYAALLVEAKAATAKAINLAPDTYLTKVAAMHTALSSGENWRFLSLAKQLRREYPGDLQVQLRIASRLARLDEGREAVSIFEDVMATGVDIDNRNADVALAYMVAGDLTKAVVYIERVQSNRLYELVLKAAILSKARRIPEAHKAIGSLTEHYPNIAEIFYPWLTGVGWSTTLLRNLDEALGEAGLEVKRP